MGFKQFLDEALSLSQWRTIRNSTKDVDWKNRHKNIFGENSRIIIPYNISQQELGKSLKSSSSSEDVFEVVKIILNQIGYGVNDYIKGLAEHMDSGKIVKIGKLFQTIEKKEGMANFLEKIDKVIGARKNYIKRILGDYSYKTLMDHYSNDPSRKVGNIDPNNLQIILSKHPYDIAGMSTGRSWTSCMAMGAENCSFIETDIILGTIVAYLVKKGDSNIENPISRILVKPYFKVDKSTKKVDYKDFYLKASQTIYGLVQSQTFPQTVQTFIDEFQKDKKGHYKLLMLYKDRDDILSIDV